MKLIKFNKKPYVKSSEITTEPKYLKNNVFEDIWHRLDKNVDFIKIKNDFLGGNLEHKSLFEFEVRVGTLDSNGFFNSNVSKKYFDIFLQRLEKNKNIFRSEKGWYFENSYYWTNIGECVNNQVRTNVQFKKNERHIEHIIKNNIFKQNIKIINNAANNPNVMRISISKEIPAENIINKIPVHVETTHVRMKIRKDFLYKNMWKYSLIKEWNGKNHQIAELNLKNNCPKYSIEIELCDASTHMSKDYSANFCSLIVKGGDLFEKKKRAVII